MTRIVLALPSASWFARLVTPRPTPYHIIQDEGETHEHSRDWLLRWYPQVVLDLGSDPLEGWNFRDPFMAEVELLDDTRLTVFLSSDTVEALRRDIAAALRGANLPHDTLEQVYLIEMTLPFMAE